MLRILVLSAFIALASAASRQDVINRCANAKNGNDTVCIGYDSDGDCSADVSKCEFSFASIRRTKGRSYRVQLVGKGGGWVSLAFSDNEDRVMAADNLAVICINTIEPPIEILQIADIPPNPEKKSSFALENKFLANNVKDGKLELHDGWMVCEFTLSEIVRHKTKTFNLKKDPLKLGLAVNIEDTIHGPDDMYANLPYYHGQTRGASAKKVNVFQKL